MSRIGKQPIEIPSGVTVDVADAVVTVKGPNGTLTQRVVPEMKISIDGGEDHRALHGLTRSLIANMVEGVTKGFEKRLEIQGVGYRAALKGKDIELQLGFSHAVDFPAPDGIEFEVPQPTRITIRGIDKQLVGETAARIRRIRKPEPYKGKGIRYEGEYVRKKAGKAAKTAVS
jgi:large subunit ribosomal protein L6